MNETNHSAGEPKGATRLESPRWRLAGLICALLLAISMVAWIKSSLWSRIEKLEQTYATLRSESFLLGVNAREALVRMNSGLLRYQLSGEDAEREKFRQTSDDLTERIRLSKAHLTTTLEQGLVGQVEVAYQDYLLKAEDFLDRALRGVRKDSATQVQQQIQQDSQRVLELADQLVQAQQSAMERFFFNSAGALESLQRLLWLSVALLLVLVASVAALIFRTVVAPLRVRLDESEAAVERHERLASLGVLAAGVAHEIRNPLTAIKFRLFSMKKALPTEFRDNEDLTIVHGELNRLERIVRDFLQFARPSEPELGEVAVSELMDALQGLLGDELAKRGIQLRLEPSPARLQADRQQILQVLINLVQNSAESMDGGTITLRAREGATKLLQRVQAVVILEVSDTGKGIPPGLEQRIFDPFFSGKENGTGLGLAIAARIVEKHGGSLQYVTQPDCGTTFSIALPKAVIDESENSPDRG